MGEYKITSQLVRRLNNRKGKPFQAILKYQVLNPDYVDDPRSDIQKKKTIGYGENKRPNPKYLEDPRDASQRRRYLYKQITKVFDRAEVKNKSDAMVALEAWKSDLLSKPTTPDDDPTVSEYVSHYIDMQESTRSIEPSTVRSYRGKQKLIDEGIGPIKLHKLTSKDITEWVAAMCKVYSPVTVRSAFRVLDIVLKYAVEVAEDLDRNPCTKVDPPKIDKRDPDSLDQDGLAKVVKMLDGMELGPITVGALIALHTGMREGEVCGLRWADIDLEGGAIRIDRAIGVGPGGAYEKGAKTSRSRRTVPLDETLASKLGKYRIDYKKRWVEARRLLGLPVTEYELGRAFVIGNDEVFCNPATLSRSWKALTTAHGIRTMGGKYCGFHALRHTFASRTISDGADVASVSAVLGHSSTQQTLDTYADAQIEGKRRAIDIMARALSPRRPAEIVELKTGTES